MKKIFEPVNLGGIKLKNRLVRSATWEGLANDAGQMPKKLFAVYDELARGGVGCIITGFTPIADDDFSFGEMVRLSNDKLIPEHKKLTAIAHKNSCPIIAQIALGGGNIFIDDLTAENIEHIKKLFVDAAKRAKQANYDGVQIHAAHGFF